MITLRALSAADTPAIGAVAEAAGVFPAEFAPMMVEMTGHWCIAEADGTLKGFAFAREEEATDRTWNILALAVDPSAQGQGLGRKLVIEMEERLSDARLLIIETTQRPDQEAARALYLKLGYTQVAQIPDFYSAGEDKIVFLKAGPAG